MLHRSYEKPLIDQSKHLCIYQPNYRNIKAPLIVGSDKACSINCKYSVTKMQAAILLDKKQCFTELKIASLPPHQHSLIVITAVTTIIITTFFIGITNRDKIHQCNHQTLLITLISLSSFINITIYRPCYHHYYLIGSFSDGRKTVTTSTSAPVNVNVNVSGYVFAIGGRV